MMMKQVCLIFPHQLFEHHPALTSGIDVVMVEEWLFFRQYRFHCKKLILHRSTMKAYEDWLKGQELNVTYVESCRVESDCRVLVESLAAGGVTSIVAADVADDWLRRRLVSACKKHGIVLTFRRTPNFFNTVEEINEFFNGRKKYFQHDFYKWQRKKKGWLLDDLGQPLGGKWSFDAENRLRFPKGAVAPRLNIPSDNGYLIEARKYVKKHFPDAYGDVDGPSLFAVTFREAEKWLDDFIECRLIKFGDYEDAMAAREPFIFHSVLTPMLNIGLLDPGVVLDKVIAGARRLSLPLNSVEGFVRQITGWREFVHIIYEIEGRFQRRRNFWGFSRAIPAAFWKGETGIEPVDRIISKVLRYGYCHHIERLMVIGNFMLLCEFDPNEVYRWFMELFLDAYDWVMVPNVYGMSQFADGGLMTTKPYISGSNYLLKMGDFRRGDWQHIWDSLFWRFMTVHRDFFSGNPRLAILLKTLDKMPDAKLKEHLHIANGYLAELDGHREAG